jgi:hypothetical protein
MRVKENVIEDGEMKKQRGMKKRTQELEKRVVELRGYRPDNRLFRADVDLVTSEGIRVNEGQVVRLHKNTVHPHLKMLALTEEIHYRECKDFVRG